MTSFLIHWLSVAASLWLCTQILPGVRVASLGALLIGGLILGLVNAIVRPVLFVLTLPITIVTLGLFYFVVNGLAFAIAAALVPGFTVTSIWSAMLGALIVSLVSWVLGQFLSRS